MEVKVPEQKKYTFSKYIMAGGIAAASHLFTLWFGVVHFGMPEVLSSIIGFSVAIAINYTLQHHIVFNRTGAHSIFLKRYIMVILGAQLLNAGLFWVFSSLLDVQYIVAQILVMGMIFIGNYFINLNYTFKS